MLRPESFRLQMIFEPSSSCNDLLIWLPEGIIRHTCCAPPVIHSSWCAVWTRLIITAKSVGWQFAFVCHHLLSTKDILCGQFKKLSWKLHLWGFSPQGAAVLQFRGEKWVDNQSSQDLKTSCQVLACSRFYESYWPSVDSVYFHLNLQDLQTIIILNRRKLRDFSLETAKSKKESWSNNERCGHYFAKAPMPRRA